MRVRVYPTGQFAEFGATRWEVEWHTVRPESVGKDDIDPDADIATHARAFATKPEAEAFAQKLVDSYGTAYGCARVTEQRVDWFVKEDRIAEWVSVGESEFID